jgi:hypothetical protein
MMPDDYDKRAAEFLAENDPTDEHLRLAAGYMRAEAEAAEAVNRAGSSFDDRGRLTPAARAVRQNRDALVKLKATLDQAARAADRKDERSGKRKRPKVTLEQRRAEMAQMMADEDDGVIEIPD